MKIRRKFCYIEVFVIRNYCVVREYGRSPECGKRPPSGRNYILTVYKIIERVKRAFRTGSPAGKPSTLLAYRLGARSGQVGLGQPTPAYRAPNPVYCLIDSRA